jgi:hypothetical protein
MTGATWVPRISIARNIFLCGNVETSNWCSCAHEMRRVTQRCLQITEILAVSDAGVSLPLGSCEILLISCAGSSTALISSTVASSRCLVRSISFRSFARVVVLRNTM